MNAKSERASLPDRVETALAAWYRNTSMSHLDKMTAALAAADACEAERNPNTTDEYVQVIFGRAEDIEADRAFVFCWVNSNRNPPPEGFVPLFARRPVSSEDVHREAKT